MHEIMAVAALPAHENIVGQYRAWQQGGHFNIQMELCDGGSLAQLLKEVSLLATDSQLTNRQLSSWLHKGTLTLLFEPFTLAGC